MLIWGEIAMNKKFVSIFLTIILIIFIFNSISGISNSTDNTLILIRVDKESYNFLINNNFEIVGSKPYESFDVIISKNKLKIFDISGISYSILISDVEKYDNLVRGSYHTLAEIESILQSISSNYPS